MTKVVDYFSDIADPRESHKCKHLLSDILLIGLFTYLSNGHDYEDMVLFGTNITDSVVTIDAMGCQKHIANQIKEQSGHYLLAVKKNQKELFEDISCAFKANKPLSIEENWEYDHGRFETRKCRILSAQSTMDEEIIAEWNGLQTIIEIESIRIIKDKKTIETRYYISDENEINALYFSYLVRGHWGIENHLHWHLDSDRRCGYF